MLLEEFLKVNTRIRHGECGIHKYIIANNIIVDIQDLSEGEKTVLIEYCNKSKILFYHLEQNKYLLHKFSYPLKRFCIEVRFNNKKFKCSNRSKKFVKFFADKVEQITERSVNVRILHTKTFNIPVSFLKKLPNRTEILFHSCSTRDLRDILEKQGFSNKSKSLLNSAQPEKKIVKKPMTILKEIKKLTKRFNTVFNPEESIYNRENVSYLLNCRLESNPISNSDPHNWLGTN